MKFTILENNFSEFDVDYIRNSQDTFFIYITDQLSQYTYNPNPILWHDDHFNDRDSDKQIKRTKRSPDDNDDDDANNAYEVTNEKTVSSTVAASFETKRIFVQFNDIDMLRHKLTILLSLNDKQYSGNNALVNLSKVKNKQSHEFRNWLKNIYSCDLIMPNNVDIDETRDGGGGGDKCTRRLCELISHNSNSNNNGAFVVVVIIDMENAYVLSDKFLFFYNFLQSYAFVSEMKYIYFR